jgi:type IV secretory pathway VirJ component
MRCGKYDVSLNDGCIYMVSDIEALSQQVQRAAGDSPYHLPIVAGVGEGGALALAIAAQTPDATIGQTLRSIRSPVFRSPRSFARRRRNRRSATA